VAKRRRDGDESELRGSADAFIRVFRKEKNRTDEGIRAPMGGLND